MSPFHPAQRFPNVKKAEKPLQAPQKRRRKTSFPKFVLPTRHFVWSARLCRSKRSESLGRKMKQLLFLVLVLAAASCRTQTMDKVSLASADADNLYINDGDSTALYYYQFVPKAAIKGVLVILPSGGESTENMLRQIQLQKRAVKAGILVVVPSINWGTVDRAAEFGLLDQIFQEIVTAHHVTKDDFVLGGLSNGAMISLKYAQEAVRNPDRRFLIPKGIFALDAPLDEARFYRYCEREIARNIFAPAVNEARWMKANYDSLYGGSPEEFPDPYIQNSIYAYGAPEGGNARLLNSMPLLMFTDLDTDWLMNQRHRDLYDWNGIDIVSMINQLKIAGNPNANVIVSQGKGIRLDGSRNPHSWSIMDTDACLTWVLQVLEQPSK
jgi:hypothetical protein